MKDNRTPQDFLNEAEILFGTAEDREVVSHQTSAFFKLGYAIVKALIVIGENLEKDDFDVLDENVKIFGTNK